MKAQKLVEAPCVCRNIGHWNLGTIDPDCDLCRGKGVRKHPKMVYTLTGPQCPSCGYIDEGYDDLSGFDIGGADIGCVFCTQCSEEIAT